MQPQQPGHTAGSAATQQMQLDGERQELHMFIEETAKQLEAQMSSVVKMLHLAIDAYSDSLSVELKRRQESQYAINQNISDLTRKYEAIVGTLKQAFQMD